MAYLFFRSDGPTIELISRNADPAGGRADEKTLARLTIAAAQALMNDLAVVVTEALKAEMDQRAKRRLELEQKIGQLKSELAQLLITK